MRAAGGRVVWIQTDSAEALAKWGKHHKYKLTPENAARRLKLLSSDNEGFKLYPALEPKADDLYVRKIKFSAMIGDSSDLDRVLRDNGIEILLVAGTKTNVCCESTARDASMMEYRVALLSDATATSTDEEHAAALNGFQISFGDVMTVDEATDGWCSREAQRCRSRTARIKRSAALALMTRSQRDSDQARPGLSRASSRCSDRRWRRVWSARRGRSAHAP